MEWVADFHDRRYYKTSSARNPEGPETGRFKVARGGAWNGSSVDLRCQDRGRGNEPTRWLHPRLSLRAVRHDVRLVQLASWIPVRIPRISSNSRMI